MEHMNMTGDSNKTMSMHMHMWMYFHTEIDDTVLFKFWTINTVNQMLLACTILAVAAFTNELLKSLRASIDRQKVACQTDGTNCYSPNYVYPYKNGLNRYFATLCSFAHLAETLLFAVQFVLGYFLMLAFMSFSVWISAAITSGAALGFYVCAANRPASHCYLDDDAGRTAAAAVATAATADYTVCGC